MLFLLVVLVFSSGCISLEKDSDGDGLSDSREKELGSNPFQKDTDKDNLDDSEELSLGSLIDEKDTDGDGLIDGNEVYTYGTNPLKKDTSGDGISDDLAIKHDLDPTHNYYKNFSMALIQVQEKHRDYIAKSAVPELNSSEKRQLDGLNKLNKSNREILLEKKIVFSKLDWDKDGFLNNNDNMPLSPNDVDNDGILDGFYNKNMNDEFDEEDLVGERGDREGEGGLEEAEIGQRDLFVEIDYMETKNHSNRPRTQAIDRVKDYFSSLPINGPNTSKGIKLHVEIDEELSHENLTYWGDVFSGYYSKNFSEKRRDVFHYAVFVHNLTSVGRDNNVSGLGRYRGKVMAIASHSFLQNEELIQSFQAQLFGHELLHNLGIRHNDDRNSLMRLWDRKGEYIDSEIESIEKELEKKEYCQLPTT